MLVAQLLDYLYYNPLPGPQFKICRFMMNIHSTESNLFGTEASCCITYVSNNSACQSLDALPVISSDKGGG